MATVKLYPGTISTVLAWTNPNNALLDDGVYAVTAGTRNTNHDIIGSDFSHSIPVGSTINSIVTEVKYKLSTTASASTLTLQAQKSGTLSGTATNSTAEPIVDTILTNANTGAWTYAELANLQVLFRVRRTSTTTCNYSVDYLAVTVDYTAPSFDFSGSASIAQTSSVDGQGNKATTGQASASSASSVSTSGLVGLRGSVEVSSSSSVVVSGIAQEESLDRFGTIEIQGTSSAVVNGIVNHSKTVELTHQSSVNAVGFKKSFDVVDVEEFGSVLTFGNKQGRGDTLISSIVSVQVVGTTAIPTYEFMGTVGVQAESTIQVTGAKSASSQAVIYQLNGITLESAVNRFGGVYIEHATSIEIVKGSLSRTIRIIQNTVQQRDKQKQSYKLCNGCNKSIQMKLVNRNTVRVTNEYINQTRRNS